MATKIKIINDLSKILEVKIQKSLKMTQDEIWNTIQEHINLYYLEYSPKRYKRTFKFQTESLIKTRIQKEGNRFYCCVEIDPEYLHYIYPSGYTSGLGVVTEANQHSHGGVYDESFGCFWNDAMQELGLAPGIKYITKKNLQKCGVPVK